MVHECEIVVAEMGRERNEGGLMTGTNVPKGDAYNDFMCCILIHARTLIIGKSDACED
jgi:hypothetical protein